MVHSSGINTSKSGKAVSIKYIKHSLKIQKLIWKLKFMNYIAYAIKSFDSKS